MKKCLVIFCLIISLVSLAQSTQPILDIAERRVPWLVPYLELKLIKNNEVQDYFKIEKNKNKILISGNNNNALARGLGHYLRFIANRSISHLGDNVEKPSKIEYPQQAIEVYSPFEYRYALNYCTLSYSMSFYTWADWQKELDWMALNGVNLVLMPLGTEVIWLRTLQQLGYSKEEAKDYIATPAFSAWWQMGNLEGWQGKITDEVIEEQRVLAHLVFKRMKALDIMPIYQGFYGNIPTTLKNKMKLNVVEQGLWAGGFQRPDFLNPQDEFFSTIAQIYYSEIKKEYGDFRFFGGDPFHEGGKVGDIDVVKASHTIQKQMQQYFPQSTWVLQGWGGNPTKEILQGLDKQKALVIELEGENTANWERREAYGGTPFIWCQISNFGEKTGLYGKIQRFADEVYRVKNSNYSKYLKGIGIIPEGIYNNPVVYDFTLDLAWQNRNIDEKVNSQDWIKKYILYRYGKTTPTLQKAWQILLNTVYKSHSNYQQGAPESMLCARPALGLKSVSSWGTTQRNYDFNEFKKAVKLFISEADKFKNSVTYQTDKIDLLRQLNSDKSLILYQEIQENIQNKDRQAFKQNKEEFLNLIFVQDQLLSTNPYFKVNTFLNQAKASTNGEESKKQALRNAKTQITYWGAANVPTTNLRDYAHKEWNGLLGSLYYHRWEAFFNWQEALLNNEDIKEPNYYQMEKEWTESDELYDITPINEIELNEIIEKMLE